ncbi:MAG TPA: glycerol-3-phosphate 1-O-acyltransferase PlsY [Thermomicrobiaceae bacterium]|nr:glycerol-3-phosphate 1-O-acyltransferase PlsY [Thermomicrobiaceae bacterium]
MTSFEGDLVRLGLWTGSYLLGSMPSGLIVARATRGVDIRRHGSGNIGTANVYRVAGRGPAALTLLGDALKGLLPVLVGHALGLPLWVLLVAGAAAIAGHNWSVFLRGRGGKGIATSIGVVVGIAPLVALFAGLIWAIVIAASRYASLASLLMMASVPALLVLLGYADPYWVFGLALVGVAIYRHRANIGRLVGGTELKISTGLGGRGD